MKVRGRRETEEYAERSECKTGLDIQYMQREEEMVSFKFIFLNFHNFEIANSVIIRGRR